MPANAPRGGWLDGSARCRYLICIGVKHGHVCGALPHKKDGASCRNAEAPSQRVKKLFSLTYRSFAFVILTGVDFLDEKSTAASIFRKRCSCGASISVHGISIVGRCSVSFFQHFHHRLYYIKKRPLLRPFLTGWAAVIVREAGMAGGWQACRARLRPAEPPVRACVSPARSFPRRRCWSPEYPPRSARQC